MDTYKERTGVFKLCSDTILLSNYVSINGVRKLCDLGCGGGALGYFISKRGKGIKVSGLEISITACELARENLGRVGTEHEVIEGDIKRYREYYKRGSFDMVVSNPPYYKAGSGKSGKDGKMREEQNCRLEDVVEAAGYLLRTGGRFATVNKPERLSRLLTLMTESGIEPKRLGLVRGGEKGRISMVVVEGKSGGGEGLKIEVIEI